jgi:hypothetical protein
MKTITRSRIYLSTAAMILTAALAIPATAQTQVPFKGTFQGNDTVAPPTITTNGTGNGTLVGQLSLTNITTLTSASGGTGTGHWVAANGDTIDTTFVASGIPGDVLFTVTEIHTITGGTGRFTGAQGSLTLLRKHVVAPSSDGTHFTWGSFQGTITPPGAAH